MHIQHTYVCIQRNLSKADSHLSASCKRPLIKRCCIVEVYCNGLLLCSAVLGRAGGSVKKMAALYCHVPLYFVVHSS